MLNLDSRIRLLNLDLLIRLLNIDSRVRLRNLDSRIRLPNLGSPIRLLNLDSIFCPPNLDSLVLQTSAHRARNLTTHQLSISVEHVGLSVPILSENQIIKSIDSQFNNSFVFFCKKRRPYVRS